MSEILGYGEDAFTFWALKGHLSEILKELKDQTEPLDCLIFFRPSFGRRGEGRAEFGEFDAILASSQNIYLIESKWGRLLRNRRDEIALTSNQVLRHKSFSWYLRNWDAQRYSNNWAGLGREINAIAMPPQELRAKVKAQNHFALTILSEPKVFLIGNDDDLKAITG